MWHVHGQVEKTEVVDPRAVDTKRSKPWAPFHPHTKAEPLTSGKVYEFNIAVLPAAVLLRKGSRLAVRITCADAG